MKQIDNEISKINIALDISNSSIDSIASNTISKPSLSDVHFPKEYNDSTLKITLSLKPLSDASKISFTHISSTFVLCKQLMILFQ